MWSNTQLLWYRSDLVPTPPTTWAEMIEQAEKLPAGENLIQVQANKYEGLVVWANQMIESAGTSILANPDEVELLRGRDQGGARRDGRAVGLLGGGPGDHDTPRRTRRGSAFESGSSAFMINYPFVYPSAEENAPDIFKVMKAAKYPGIYPGHSQRPAARRHQPRRLRLLEEQGPRLRGDRVPGRGREPDRDRRRSAGCRPCARTSTTRPRSKKIYPGFAEVIRQSIEDAGAAPVGLPRLPGHLAGDPERRPPDHRHRPRGPDDTYEDLQEKLEQAVKREGLL